MKKNGIRSFLTSKIFSFFVFLLLTAIFPYSAESEIYWGEVQPITKVNSQFPVVVSGENNSFLFFEEILPGNEIYLNVQKKRFSADGQTQIREKWSEPKRFAGPFKFTGAVPDIYSVAVTRSGIIAVAVMVSDRELGIYFSDDNGENFSFYSVTESAQNVVGPRIFSTAADGLVLFAAYGTEDSFKLFYSRSTDGRKWTEPVPFAPSADFSNSFSPYLCKIQGGDMVVFQAQMRYTQNGISRTSYQLFSAYSKDNLRTWSKPVMITDEKSVTGDVSNMNFNNQRPVVCNYDGKLYLSWERTYYSSASSGIWFAELTKDGKITGQPEEITENSSAHRPEFYKSESEIALVWFDNSRGNDAVFTAVKNGLLWEKSLLHSGSAGSSFVFPVISRGGEILSFVWQEKISPQTENENSSQYRIYALEADDFVEKPQITAKNFRNGRKTKEEKAEISVVLPEDSSGIAGFSWVWTENEKDEPPETFMNLPEQSELSFDVKKDGTYYFKVRASDYAGNWSEPAVVSFCRDVTPPPKVELILPETDEFGFASSNTFSLSWKMPDERTPDENTLHTDGTSYIEDFSDVEEFRWSFERISAIEPRFISDSLNSSVTERQIKRYTEEIFEGKEKIISSAKEPSRTSVLNERTKRISNAGNGIYVFSVCAVDETGNVSEKSSAVILLNKYLPEVEISALEVKRTKEGGTGISVHGSDFLTGGSVTEIYIDSDGKFPYDRTLYLKSGDYKIESNSLISGIDLGTLDAGEYGIYIFHSKTGIYPKNSLLKQNKFTVERTGTIKVERPYKITREWLFSSRSNDGAKISSADIIVLLFVIFIILGIFALAKGFAGIVRESAAVKNEVNALLQGDFMTPEKISSLKGSEKNESLERILSLKKRGGSLKFKLMSFTALLVLLIVMLISVALGINMIKTQERTLASGLLSRINVLMESMTSGVRSYLPTGLDNILELNYLPQQTDSFEEAEYATITGRSSADRNSNLNYVWASNDADILRKIDSEQWSYGSSAMKNDETETKIAENLLKIESDAKKSAGEIEAEIRELNRLGAELARAETKEEILRRNEINDKVRLLNEELTRRLNKISVDASASVPAFDSTKLNRNTTEYIFYKPVLYRQAGDENFLHAVIFMKISTENLISEVDSATRYVLFTSFLIAVFAISVGIIGSFILASRIVRPIKILVEAVNKIGATKDKKLLKYFKIDIKSNDEIGTLGEAVKEMTAQLQKAAEDEEKAQISEKLALDGKAVQQTFLPLAQNKAGGKETTAELKEKNVHFFGYYEGADAVSGDYFDWKKLDDRYYAVIKCDASGHGVPAALIMTVVATLFRKYFENWNKGANLDALVLQINDFIESLGVKGKFATLLICLIDTQTGEIQMCNAGDNIVHIYDASEKSEKILNLWKSPAAGPLPSFMVEMKGGFKVEKTKLEKDDILFLYTDGIEESTRYFRDSEYRIIECNEQSENGIHGNHKTGEKTEQLESVRVKEIIEAVLNRKLFTLYRWHDPLNEKFEFDFTAIEGTVSETIIALVAVEKVFRMYKTPDSKGSVTQNEKGDTVIQGDVVKADRKIDEFLKKTFRQYEYFCADAVDLNETNYVYYENVSEDPQADDLTLLAIKKL